MCTNTPTINPILTDLNLLTFGRRLGRTCANANNTRSIRETSRSDDSITMDPKINMSICMDYRQPRTEVQLRLQPYAQLVRLWERGARKQTKPNILYSTVWMFSVRVFRDARRLKGIRYLDAFKHLGNGFPLRVVYWKSFDNFDICGNRFGFHNIVQNISHSSVTCQQNRRPKAVRFIIMKTLKSDKISKLGIGIFKFLKTYFT